MRSAADWPCAGISSCIVHCWEQCHDGNRAYHHGSLSLLGGHFQLGLQCNELLLHVCHTALCSSQLLQTHLIPLPYRYHLQAQCSDARVLPTLNRDLQLNFAEQSSRKFANQAALPTALTMISFQPCRWTVPGVKCCSHVARPACRVSELKMTERAETFSCCLLTRQK